MRIAAVIVHYQTPVETQACLRALGASTRPIDLLIVVDNGSARPWIDATIRAEQNLGFGGGCNLGIARALSDGADLVLLINSDAEVAPDCVARLESVLSAHPEAGIIGPAVVNRAGRIESLGVRFSSWSGRMSNRGAGSLDGNRPAGPFQVDAVVGCCMLIRREVFARVGAFTSELFYGFEDLELCLRARRAGLTTLCQPAATVRHAGARTIGATSPDRLYFAVRNHLRVAQSAAPLPPLIAVARSAAIVVYNLAHALLIAPVPRAAGLRAVARGVEDYLRGRYGPRADQT